MQRVEQAAWDAIEKLADKGGWRERQIKRTDGQKERMQGDEGDAEPSPKDQVKQKGNSRKRKVRQAGEEESSVPVRRSTRARTKA